MIEDLGEIRWLGKPWPTEKRSELQRVMLRKTEVHLYFQRYSEETRIVCEWANDPNDPTRVDAFPVV